MTSTKCRAKNPSLCPHHGDPTAIQITDLRSKISSIFTKQPPVILAPTFGSADSTTFQAKIEILPITKTAKTRYSTVVEASSYSELMNKLRDEANDISGKGLNENLKSGYQMRIDYPINETDPSVTTYASEYNVQSFNQMSNVLNNTAKEAEELNTAVTDKINELEDSKLGQKPKGIKGIALMKTMAKFNFFNGNYSGSDIEAAWDSIVDHGTSEYTNRSSGIRVHPRYDNNGELKEASFSLDHPDSPWGLFSQEQVNKANGELKNYFKDVNVRFDKKA